MSARVAAEQRLAQTQELHRSLVERLPLVTYIDRLAPKNPPLWVSPQIQALVGYTPEEWVADPDLFGRIVHPDDRDRILALTITGESARSYAEEYRMIARDGRVVWVRDEATLVRDADGRPLYIQGFWQDITERKLAAEALQAAEAKYRSLVEQIQLVTYIDRADWIGASLYMSPQIEPLLGHPLQQWMDDDELFSRLVHPDDQERVREATLRSIETLEGYDSEYRLIAADGRTVWVHDVGRIVTDQAGAPLFLQGYLVDVTEQVEARERIEETERRYRELVERLPLTTYIEPLDPGTAPLYVSPQIEGLLGYPAAAWMADPSIFQRTLHPDDRERTLAEYAASQRELARRAESPDGSPDATARRVVEYRLIARDGRAVWIRDESTVVRGADGAVPLAQGFMLDITEQKLTEGSAAAAQQRYRDLVEQLPLITYTDPIDRPQAVTYVSPQVVGTFGYPIESWTAAPGFWMSVIHPDDRERVMSEVDEAIAGLVPRTTEGGASTEPAALRTEYRVISQDGRVVWIRDQFTIIRDDQGNPAFTQGFLLDITEQKLAEGRIREAELRYRQLLEGLSLIVFTADLAGHVTYVSPQAEAVLGYPSEAFLGEQSLYRSLIHPGDRERYTRVMDRAIADQTPLQIEHRIVGLGGRVQWIRNVSEMATDESGHPTHVLGYVLDITAQRQAEEALAQAQKLESLGVLAGGIAHDFNNLLVAILGHAGLALMDLPEGGPARADVEQIELAAKRAAELAGALLAYSGRGKFVIGRLDASELVRETARLLEVSTGSRTQIRYELADDLPPIEGDATQLRQVVMNLVINASDAIEGRQGVISITTATVEVGPDEATELRAGDTLEPGRYVLIEVADTGAGMDEATRARIFEPFFTTKFTGRGLGLAAVQGIVRGHHGAIGVRSEPGQGSRFRVFLPQAAGVAGTPDRVPAPAAGQRGSETILVIDDDDTVRAATARMLQVKGFRTVVAADGPEGIKAFREGEDTIDAVLVDLTMPRMSGLEVMRAIREIRSDARIVLMSGYSEPAAGEARESDAPAGFIQKPFTPANLSSVVRAALESP